MTIYHYNLKGQEERNTNFSNSYRVCRNKDSYYYMASICIFKSYWNLKLQNDKTSSWKGEKNCLINTIKDYSLSNFFFIN